MSSCFLKRSVLLRITSFLVIGVLLATVIFGGFTETVTATAEPLRVVTTRLLVAAANSLS